MIVAALKYGVYAACGYEAWAGVTRRQPTISQLVGRRPWLGVPVIVALSAHFYWPHERTHHGAMAHKVRR